MKILIADDDMIVRQMLRSLLVKWGYDVVVANDGKQAWEILNMKERPCLGILDWVMPEMEGAEICREFRKQPGSESCYLILLTFKGKKEDIVEGLRAGANDYITKPFDHEELKARVSVGRKMVELQKTLSMRVQELEEALAHIRQLQDILPICSYCKKVRDDQNYWQQLESYLYNHSEVRFSHSVCPECYEKYVSAEMQKLRESSQNQTLPNPGSNKQKKKEE